MQCKRFNKRRLKSMAKYLVTWEMDMSKVPIGRKERAAAWMPMLDMVGQDMKKGVLKDWGSYTGELRGFAVAEGTRIEIDNMVQQYVPFVDFTLHELVSLTEMIEVNKNLAK
jgi:hypothetical protein